jgi:phenylacetate-CoA ligase
VSDANAVGAENRRRIVLHFRDQFLDLARASREQVDQFAFNELKNIVKFSKQRIPWYTNSFASVGDVDGSESLQDLLQSLPILSRRQAQENFDGLYFKSPENNPADYVIQATSGSTGKPVSVMKFAPLYSAEYDALTLTEWQLNKRDTSKTLSTFRIVQTELEDAPLGPPLSYIGATRVHTSRSILKRSIPELLNELHRLRPDYLFVNGVVARQLALAQLDSDNEPIKIEQFLTVSDRIDPQLRTLIREVFGGRIIDRYSSEEFGYIALQCPVHDHLHVCSPSLVVEVVDDEGNACDVGVPGRVLVTSLHNFAMPLIRYDIGDIAEFGEPCDSGFNWPVLNQVNGRIRDSITLPNGEFRLVTFFDSKMLGTRKLRDYQIVLFENAIVFLYHVNEELDESERADIEAELQNSFKLQFPIVFRRMQNENWQNVWKRREWYRASTNYEPSWNESELLSKMSE